MFVADKIFHNFVKDDFADLEAKMGILDSSAEVYLKSTRETTLQLTSGPYLSMLWSFA
jgi:hypothetical protein